MADLLQASKKLACQSDKAIALIVSAEGSFSGVFFPFFLVNLLFVVP